MTYKPKHFEIEELVNPKAIKAYGNLAWTLLDPHLLEVIDHLREKFGACTINDWSWGGAYKNSGLRVDWGSKGSAHWFGMAFDLKFIDATPKEVRKYIMGNQRFMYELGLKRIENVDDTPTWIHLDSKPCIEVPYGSIYEFKP